MYKCFEVFRRVVVSGQVFAFLLSAVFGVCLTAVSLRAQATIHVPADKQTIQAGIDVAQNGDTILVSPGTYNENIDFKGKAITVTTGAKSFSDPAVAATIINGSGLTPSVTFQTNEPLGATLNGFTVESTVAADVYLLSSSGTISNNVISKVVSCGVIAIGAGASPMIRANRVNGAGAAMRAYTCIGANVAYNNAVINGGISAVDAGDVQIVGNTVDGLGACRRRVQREEAPSS